MYETPPPTHGVAALVALNILEELSPSAVVKCSDCDCDSSQGGAEARREALLLARGSVEQAHLGIESMRVAFSDSLLHVADPATVRVERVESVGIVANVLMIGYDMCLSYSSSSCSRIPLP